ncbi:MAG: transglycosylase SLT domain-containing protein [Thermodesulfobacteriota bacterium]
MIFRTPICSPAVRLLACLLIFIMPAFLPRAWADPMDRQFKVIEQRMTNRNEVDATAEAFKRQEKDIERQYATEKAAIEQSYKTYQRIIEEAYRAYEKEILKTWVKAEISTAKRWVEYAPDYQSRHIVDFDQQYLQIDINVTKDMDALVDLLVERKLREMMTEDQKTAFERDMLAQNVEKRITQESPFAQTGNMGDNPVLLRMITGKDRPSDREIDAAIADLRRNATLSRAPSKMPDTDVVTLRVALPAGSMHRKAMEYRPMVQSYAAERGLNEALVFAVIHTESAFNPMACSHVPAYGLMQIVPQSAGRDASEFIFGQEMLLSPSYLYQEANNINMGTAYLYLLYNRYLTAIKDPLSRMYCAIAAYNTGPGNVARAFAGTTNVDNAAGIINRMTPDQVYTHLINRLPYQETRDYLQKVTSRMALYQSM